MKEGETRIYQPPGFVPGRILNPVVALLTKAGVLPAASQMLTVRGRASGERCSQPVNLLEHRGGHYLVAPRGETHWVRNLRAAGEGELRHGRRARHFTATEIPAADRPPMIRAYLERWASVTKANFGADADANASEQELRRIAPQHPVFRVEFATA